MFWLAAAALEKASASRSCRRKIIRFPSFAARGLGGRPRAFFLAGILKTYNIPGKVQGAESTDMTDAQKHRFQALSLIALPRLRQRRSEVDQPVSDSVSDTF
jgi:hypothetical protein